MSRNDVVKVHLSTRCTASDLTSTSSGFCEDKSIKPWPTWRYGEYFFHQIYCFGAWCYDEELTFGGKLNVWRIVTVVHYWKLTTHCGITHKSGENLRHSWIRRAIWVTWHVIARWCVGLEIRRTVRGGAVHFGVYCVQPMIARGTKFGPYRGRVVNPSEIKVNNDNSLMWEVSF